HFRIGLICMVVRIGHGNGHILLKVGGCRWTASTSTSFPRFESYRYHQSALIPKSAPLRAPRRTTTSEAAPVAIRRDAVLRTAPRDEVRGFQVSSRPMSSVSWNQSTRWHRSARLAGFASRPVTRACAYNTTWEAVPTGSFLEEWQPDRPRWGNVRQTG